MSWSVDLAGLAEGDFLGFALYRIGADESPANGDDAGLYAWEWSGWFWQ